MGGVEGPMKKPHGEPSRKALALRKWNCRSEETATEAANFAQQAAIAIAMKKDGKKPKNESSDPCWTGYHQIGMKNKGGKPVPNCVPEDVMQKHADHKVVRVKKANGNFMYRKIFKNKV
jgi:hypothetical protein